MLHVGGSQQHSQIGEVFELILAYSQIGAAYRMVLPRSPDRSCMLVGPTNVARSALHVGGSHQDGQVGAVSCGVPPGQKILGAALCLVGPPKIVR